MSDNPKSAWVKRVLGKTVGPGGPAIGGHRAAPPAWAGAQPKTANAADPVIGAQRAAPAWAGAQPKTAKAAGPVIGTQRAAPPMPADSYSTMEAAAAPAYETMQPKDPAYETMQSKDGGCTTMQPREGGAAAEQPREGGYPTVEEAEAARGPYESTLATYESTLLEPARDGPPPQAAPGIQTQDNDYLYSSPPLAAADTYVSPPDVNKGPDLTALPPGTAAWASGVDFSKLKVGAPIKAGAYGEVSWLEADAGAGEAPADAPKLVFKVPKGQGSRNELEHEAAFYAKAGDHPNLPKCLGMCDVGGKNGLVMEGIKGKDMAGTVDKMREQYDNGKLSHEKFFGSLQYMLTQMVDTIEHLGKQGIVHADIRPDNIMIDGDTGGVKVVDFGVAVEAGQKAGKQPVFAGSVSPDAVKPSVDQQHDMFGAGAAAYEAGEREKFRYNDGPGKAPGYASLRRFAAPDETGAAKKAVRPADGSNPAFTMEADGDGESAKKVPGRFGADTDYTKFINAMMHPDKNQRLTPEQARNHPFLADPLLDEAAAREVLQGVLNPQQKPPPGPNDAPPPRAADEPLNYLDADGSPVPPAGGAAPAAAPPEEIYMDADGKRI